METVNWGIIGCGDVTEKKSGPAFNKVPNSKLVAVMRRNANKAEDYATRHGVPKWYSNVEDLINDDEVNAIYIATPPLYHEEYTIAASQAGKPVYVEKPAALTEAGCLKMAYACIQNNTKLSVAHYRRALPLFNKVKSLLSEQVIGDLRFINLQMLQPYKTDVIANVEDNWRVNPAISGGGLFHDLAPHQLDILFYYFGNPIQMSGMALNNSRLHAADDIVSGEMLFDNQLLFKGLWCFSVAEHEAKDVCEIVGSKGKISFPFFGNDIQVTINGKTETIHFEHPTHIQQPMIEQVVKYFRGEGPNPCSAHDAAEVLKMMDSFTSK